jgi:transposase-like protein
MTSTIEQVQIVKTDARGRIRYTAERREAIVAEFGRSGLSAVKFASLAGVKYQTLAGWIARAKKAASHNTRAPVRWVEAVVDSPVLGGKPGQAPVVVHLTGNMKVELASETQVELVVRLIRGLQAC